MADRKSTTGRPNAAIRRTTPVLLGLFSLITLWADDLFPDAHPVVCAAN